MPSRCNATLGGGDGSIVDAGDAAAHEAVGVEFPEFIAVGAEPLTGVVVPFVFERDGDAISVEGPERFFYAVLEFTIPFAAEEGRDFGAAGEEFRPATC